jgi:hypothetical protein
MSRQAKSQWHGGGVVLTKNRNGVRPEGTAGARPAEPAERPLPSSEPAGERQRDDIMGRLFAGVFTSAREHLLAVEGPLGAEVWASGMLSVWSDEKGWRRPDGSTGFAGALVRYASTLRSPEAAALLAATAGVAQGALAQAAAAAANDLWCAGVPTPAWAELVGRAQPTEAWVGTDAYGDQDILILGFGYEGRGALPLEERHTICVLVDHNLEGAAKDAYPAADLAVTLGRWRDTEAHGIYLRQVSLSEAAGRLADALSGPPPAAGRLADLWALLGARLAMMPTPERGVPPVYDEMAQEAIVAGFLESPEAAGLLFEPRVTDLCRRLVAYRCNQEAAGTRDADPLRWSPTLVARYLLDATSTTAADLDPVDLAAIPDVLTAWVRYAARTQGVTQKALTRTLAAIEASRVEFTLLIGEVTPA